MPSLVKILATPMYCIILYLYHIISGALLHCYGVRLDDSGTIIKLTRQNQLALNILFINLILADLRTGSEGTVIGMFWPETDCYVRVSSHMN